MKMTLSQTVYCLLINVIVFSGFGWAQQSPTPAQRTGFTTNSEAAPEANSKRVGFRAPQWKTLHGHDQASANKDVETLKQIGCEAKLQNHGNHIDVQYRCAAWKTIEVPSEQLVEQWSTWLTSKGLETVVVNPSATTAKHTVQYRMPQTRTLHLHDQAEAAQILDTMKMIGVSVTTNSHGDHMDATFQCPEWKTIQLPSDGHAHSWQNWLNEAGFETKHSH